MNIFNFSGSTRALLALAIALVPAMVSYFRGRQLARFADSPALPEQLFAQRGMTTKVLAFAISLLLMLTGSAAIWAIPLTVIAYAAAGLPLRRILYSETWSLAAYLSFVIRFFVAGWGFWLLVSALPALAFWWSGERAWIVGLLAGAGLMLLAERQTEWIRWLIGAKPIVDETIRARFDRLVAAANLAVPHFEFVDLKGGSFANAFALPSLGRGAVVFTGPLLERLDADETDAICAHELAHLEYYSPRRLRRQRLLSRALIIGGVALGAVLHLIPSFAWLACAGWPSVVLISIAILVHDRQKHETASDLRAVALTGNPEALVRGLTKLHAIARVPRRWDADLERHMSHPSLKRRIHDIRAAAGTAPAVLGHTSVFESPSGAARVTFGDECLEWIDGASASYRLRYERLGELRVDATRAGEPSLLASDRAGRRWHMPLRLDDVPRLQAVLDIIDARVETSAGAEGIQPMLVRAAALTVFIVSLNAGLIGVSVVLAMALARPEAPLLCAAGVAAMAGALLRWRDPGSMYGLIPGEYDVVFAVALFAGGALLLWLAYVRRRNEVTPRGWKLIGALAGAALASWVLPIAGRGVDAVGLHLAVRDWPASVMLPLALAGAMMCAARKALRIASVGAVAVSVAGAWIGSQAFLDRFGDDLFLERAPEVEVRTLNHPIKEFTVPFTVSSVQLSPGGASIAAITRRYNGGTTVHIGRVGETLIPIDADDALFIDDDHALVWTVDGSRTELREVLVSSPDEAGWQLRVTGLSTPVVTLDRPSRRWRLMNPAGVNVLEAREGVVGTEQITTHRWDVPQRHGSPFMPIAMAGGRTLAIEPRPDLSSSLADFGALVFVLAGTPHWRSTLWAVGPDGASDLGTSRLELQCHPLPLVESGLCHVFDSSRTRFFSMNPRTNAITAVAALPGRLYVGDEPQGSWITGWSRSGPVGVRLAPVDAIRIVDAQGADAHMLALSDRMAAGIWHQFPPASTLRVEPVHERTGTSLIRIYSIE